MILRKFRLKSGTYAINGLYSPDEYDELLGLLKKRIDEGDEYSEEYKVVIEQIERSTQTANNYDISRGAEADWKTFVIYNEHILEFIYLALRMPVEKEKSNLEIELKDKMLEYAEEQHNEFYNQIKTDSIIQIKRLIELLNQKDQEIENLKGMLKQA